MRRRGAELDWDLGRVAFVGGCHAARRLSRAAAKFVRLVKVSGQNDGPGRDVGRLPDGGDIVSAGLGDRDAVLGQGLDVGLGTNQPAAVTQRVRSTYVEILVCTISVQTKPMQRGAHSRRQARDAGHA
jgi:hypothetical protein